MSQFYDSAWNIVEVKMSNQLIQITYSDFLKLLSRSRLFFNIIIHICPEQSEKYYGGDK